ncbi:MAG: recombinase family protein, partial [Mogibacterium sp.]|nr:recombinase family protein [Mogibacterium sp.]
MYYAYARVSTKNQNEERQLIALREYLDRECDHQNSIIYTDKESGKNFDRPGYKNLIRMLEPGDIFVVESIDRLGRNYDEILEQWRIITKEKDCDIVVLDMPLLDTRKSRDLTGTLISDMVLQILSYVSQKERELLKRRQAEGVAAAKARGVKFCRTAIERPANYA